MATLVRFMISIMAGIMKLMARLVNSCVRISSVEALSKRCCSNAWRSKARTTAMPESISRAIRFTLSISFCMILNFGSVKRNSTPMTRATATMATTMIHPSAALVANTMMMPPIAIRGA